MAKRRQKPLTKTQQFHKQWKKEVARIKRAIKSLQQRGFTVDYTFPEMPEHISPKKLAELRSETTPAKMLSRSTYVTKDGEIISGRQAQTEMHKKAGRKGALTKKRNEYARYREKKEKERLESAWKAQPREQMREAYPDRNIVTKTGTVLATLEESLKEWERPTAEILAGYRYNRNFELTLIAKQKSANALLNLLETKINNEGETRVMYSLEANATEINSALEDFNKASGEDQVNTHTVKLATLINGASLTKEQSEAFDKIAEQMTDFAN